MLTEQPSIKTELTPRDIIGINISAFTAHCRTWGKKDNHRGEGNVMAAKTIDRLKENGYIVSGEDSYGNLTFSVITKSKIQQLFEGPEFDEIKRMSFAQMQAKARGGFVKIARDGEM